MLSPSKKENGCSGGVMSALWQTRKPQILVILQKHQRNNQKPFESTLLEVWNIVKGFQYASKCPIKKKNQCLK